LSVFLNLFYKGQLYVFYIYISFFHSTKQHHFVKLRLLQCKKKKKWLASKISPKTVHMAGGIYLFPTSMLEVL